MLAKILATIQTRAKILVMAKCWHNVLVINQTNPKFRADLCVGRITPQENSMSKVNGITYPIAVAPHDAAL